LPFNGCYVQEEGETIRKTMNSSPSPMSVLVGTGKNNIIFYGLYVISSTLGFLILSGLLHILYSNPFAIASWWYTGLLLVICMLASVFLFGGLVVGILHLHFWGQNATKEEREDCCD
jgi:ferric-chelate reductase